MLPRRSRSTLRKVDGRRLNREGRCCPRVEIALPSFCSGRNSLLLAIRGRLDERGTEAGEGDFGGGVVAPRRSAMFDRALVLKLRKCWSLEGFATRI